MAAQTGVERDAARYQWIKRHSTLELGHYCSETGWLLGATSSNWHVMTEAGLVGTNRAPKMDAAIDAAMAKEAQSADEDEIGIGSCAIGGHRRR